MKIKAWIIVILQILASIALIACIIASAVACVKYGGKPVTEIPAWALMFMFGGGK